MSMEANFLGSENEPGPGQEPKEGDSSLEEIARLAMEGSLNQGPVGDPELDKTIDGVSSVEEEIQREPEYELEPGGNVYIKIGGEWKVGTYSGVTENREAIITPPRGEITKEMIDRGEALGFEQGVGGRIVLQHADVKRYMQEHDLEVVRALEKKEELGKVANEINDLLAHGEARDEEKRKKIRGE
ncbi:MAG: hypothetical protein V1489_00195 [Candidatus Liptonbacteria bacterium]